MFATDALPPSLIYISSRNGEDCLSIYSFGNKNVPSRGLNVLFLAPRMFVFDSDGGKGSREKLVMWAALSDQRCWTRRDLHEEPRVAITRITADNTQPLSSLNKTTEPHLQIHAVLIYTHTHTHTEMWGQRSELCWSAIDINYWMMGNHL